MGLIAKLYNIFVLIVFTLILSGCNVNPGSKTVDSNHPSEIVVESTISPLSFTKSKYPSISIMVRDVHSSSVAGATVEVMTDSGSATLRNQATDSSGRAFIDWTFGDNTGVASLIINASLNGFVATKVITINLTTSTVSELNSSITGTSQVTAEGVSLSTVTISLKDERGIGVPGISPLFSATDTGGKNSYRECSPSDTNGYSNCVFKSTKAEDKVLQLLSPVNISGDTVTFIPGPLASLIFSTQALATDADSAFAPQPVIKGIDAFGNIISEGLASEVKLTPFSATNCSGNILSTSTLAGTNSTSFSNGEASFSGLSPLKTSLKSLKATYEKFSVCSNSINVLPGAANSIEFDSQPSLYGVANINLSNQPVIKIYDANYNLKNNAAFFVSLTGYADANCTIPVADGLTASANPVTTFTGVAAFSNLKILKTNVIRLGASDGTRTVCSRPVSILPAPVSSIAFTTQPSASTTDYLFSPQPLITAYDAFGNIVTNNSSSIVSLMAYDSPSCGGNALSSGMTGNTSLVLSRGVASFSNAKPFTTSIKSIKASLGSLTTCSNSITVFSGDTASLAFTTQPSSTGNTDSNLITQPVVKMYDANLNIKPDAIATVTLRAYSDTNCTSVVTGGVTASSNPVSSVSGVAAFSGVKVLKTNVIRLGASDGVRTVCSSAIAIAPGALNNMAFTNQPEASTTDTLLASQPKVTAYDANGNILTNNSSSFVSLSAYDGASCSGNVVASALSGTTSVALTNGVATFVSLRPLKTSIQSLKASIGSVDTCSTILTVAPGAASSLAFTSQPSLTGTTDTALVSQPMIKIFDDNLNIKTDSNASVTLTGYADSACTIPVTGGLSALANPVSSTNGSATFSALRILKTNVVRIGASDGIRTTCSNPIVISAGGLSSLAFTTRPVATNTDSLFSTQPVVSAYDASGNVLTNDSVTSLSLVSYDSSDCSGNVVSSGISGVTSKSLASGVASFLGLKPLKTSIQSIKVSAGTISACSGPVVVAPGAAASLAFSVQPPATGNTDSILDTQPVIQILDANLNLKTDSSSSITLTAYANSSCTTAVSGGLSALTNPQTAVNGVASFRNVTVLKTNVVRIGATDGTRTICSNALALVPGAVSSIAFTTQPQATTTDSSFSVRPVITAFDNAGNIVTSDSSSEVAITAYDSPSCSGDELSLGLGGAAKQNLLNGTTSFVSLKPLLTSIQSLKATLGTFTTCSHSLSVLPGAASSIAFTNSPSATGTTDLPLDSQPVIKIFDANLNIKTDATSSVTLTAYSDSSCTTPILGGLSASSNPLSAVNGVATFSNLKVLKSNAIRIGASDGTRTTCSSAISIEQGALATLAFTTQPLATNTDSAFSTQPEITGYDANGNILANDSNSNVSLSAFDNANCSGNILSSGLSGTSSVTFSSGVASFNGLKPLKTSIQSLKASIGSISVCSNRLTVYPGAASSLAFSTQPSSTGDTDSALSSQPVLKIYDANSNLKTDDLSYINLTAYSDAACTSPVVGGLSATSNPATSVGGVASFSGVRILKTNVVRIGASDGVRTVCSSSIALAPGTLNSLAFTTQPVATSTDSDLSSQPVVTAYDVSGNILTNDSASTLTLTAYDTSSCAGSMVAPGLSGSTTLALSEGVAAFASLRPIKTTIKSIKATSGSISTCSNTLSVQAGNVTTLAFTTQPVATNTDSAFSSQPVVTAYDSNGNILANDSTSAVALTAYSEASCNGTVVSSAFSGNSSKAITTGVAGFSALKPISTSIKSIKATIGAVSSCSDEISVLPGSASLLTFTTQPSSTTTTDSALASQPVLKIYDANSNIKTDSSASITLTAYSDAACTTAVAGGLTASANPVNAVMGVVTIANLRVLKTNVVRIGASDGTRTACSNAISVSAGAVSNLAFTTMPVATTTDSAFSTQPVVTGYDANGNILENDSISSVSLTAYDGVSCSGSVVNAGFSGSSSLAFTNGIASFSSLKPLKTTIKSLKAAVGSVETCSTSLSVYPGAASSLAFSTQPSPTGDTDSALSTQPVLKIYDANSNLKTDDLSYINLTAYSDAACTATVVGGLSASSNPATSVGGVASFSGVRILKTNVVRIGASDGVRTICSNALSIGQGVISSLAFTTQPTASNTDSTFTTQPVVTAYDASGNVLTNDSTSSLTLTAFDSAACAGNVVSSGITGTTTKLITSGVASFTSLSPVNTSIQSLKATVGTVSICSNSLTVAPGAASSIAFTTQPSPTATTDGALSTQPVLKVFDANLNIKTDSTAALTLTGFSDATCTSAVSGGLSATTNPVTVVNGVATFAAVKILKTNVIRIGATDGVRTICSDAVAISAGSLSTLAFTTQPVATNTDSNFSSMPALTAYDVNGNVLSNNSTSTVTLAAYDATSCSGNLVASGLSGTTSLSLTNGVASFTGLRPLFTSIQSIKASIGAVTICSNALSVSPGAASSVAFTTQPSSTGTTDAALSSSPVIKVYDANSNIKTDSSASITLTAYSDASCTVSVSGGLSATANPVSAVSGVATFANVKVLKTSVIRIGASDGTRTTCSSAMVISAGALSTIAFTTVPPTSNTTDADFATQPVVKAYDANGNVMTNNSSSLVTLEGYSGYGCGGSAVASGFSGANPLALTSGVATFSSLRPIKTMSSIKASIGTVTVCAGYVPVYPGAAASIAFSTQPSSTGTTDSALTSQPVISIYDANSNIKWDASTPITLKAYSDASCTTEVTGGISATANPLSPVGGLSTFANVKVLKTNVIRLGASDGTRTACSSAMMISQGALATLAFTTQPVGTNTDTAFSTQPVITAYDANGNTLTNDSTSSITLTAYDTASCGGSLVTTPMSGTTTKTLASGVASFTALTPIKTTVKSLKATSGAVSACSNTLTVSPGAAASLAYTTQPSSTGTTDAALAAQPVIKIYDANSNIKTDSAASVTLTAYSDASCTVSVASGLSATTNPVTAVSGVATFANVKVLKTSVIRIGASDGTRTTCSSAMVISAGAISTLAFTTQPVATTTDTAFSPQPVVTAYDANGNTLTNDSTSSIALTAYDTASCGGSLVTTPMSGTTTKTLTSGVATFTSLIPIKTTVKSLKATSGAVSICSNTLTVSPGAAASLAYTTQPSATGTTDAALASQPVIKVYDANSNIKTDSAASITLAAYSDASCTTVVTGGLSATTNPVTAVSGVATFANVKILKTNVIRIRATDGTRTICSSAMVISAGAISTLAFTTQPVATTTDTAFSPQPVVTAYDANGNTLTNDSTSSIALTAYDTASCGGSLVTTPMSGTTTKTLTSGVATFASLIPIKTTVKSLKATSGAVSICSNTLTVSPGAAASLAYTTQPSATGTTDAALASQPVIKVYDANSNIKTDSAASITLAAYSDASCTTVVTGGLSATTNPVTAVSGVATFANVKILKTNVIRIRATDGTRTICSSAMVISAGTASSLAFTTQPVATNTDTAFSAQPVVTAYDANGNTLSNDSTSTVALTAYDTAACAGSVISSSLSGTTTKTLASGIATFTTLTPIKTTVKSLKATSGAVSICSNTLTVSPGAAASIAFTTQPSSTGTTDSVLASQPVLTVYDANANIKTDSAASITLAAYSDGSCTTVVTGGLSATTNPVTAVSGVATFTNVKALKTNIIRMGASDGTRTICSNAMVISAGAISTLAFTTQPVATNTDTALSSQPVVTAYDSNGNVLVNNSTSTLALTAYDAASCAGNLVSSAFSGTTSLNLSSGVASFAALKPLKTTIKSIKATVGSVTACSNTLSVSAGAAANIAITSGNSQSGAVNSALTAFSVYVTDANSNAVPSTSVSWTILSGAGSLSAASSLTSASGVASSTLTLGTTAGTNSVIASIAGTNVTFSATATAGQAATIAISAGDAQSASVGSPLPVQLTVLVKDAYSNPVSAQTINWSNLTGTGSLSAATSTTNSSGLASITYTLGVSAGTNTVSATVDGQAMLSKTFTATGVAGAATKIAISSGNNQSSYLGAGLTSPLIVNVQDNNNNYVNGAVINWSATNSATLSSASSTSGTNGNSTISVTSVGYVGGPQTATATLNGTTTAVSFNYNAMVPQADNLAGVAGDGSAALTWNAVTGATSYKIYTSTTSGSGFTLLDTSTTASYTASLANGVTYYLYVTAVSGTIESDPSNEIAVTPVASGTSTAAGWLRQIGKLTGKQISDPKNIGMIGDDLCKGMAIDPNGFIYCAGSSSGAFSETNNNYVSQNSSDDAFVMKLNPSGEVEWITQLGLDTKNTADQDDSCESVTFDNDGYVYCAGYTWGSIGEGNAGGSDAFIVKISPTGSLEWVKQLGSQTTGTYGSLSDSESFTSIKVHTDGSIFAAGYTLGSLGDQNNGNQDAIITKFDSTGNMTWIYQLGANSGKPNTYENDNCTGLALDQNGNAYCGGYTGGDLGDGMSWQWMDSFVMKVDYDGNLIWVTQFGGGHKSSGEDFCSSIAVDASGSTYCAGATTGIINTYNDPNGGGYDAYIMKLDPQGNYEWITQLTPNNGYNTSANEICRGVGLDDSGNIYCSGTTDGSLSEGNAGQNDIFMMKVDPKGGIVWARQLGDNTTSPIGNNSGNDTCYSTALDAQGNIYCAGFTTGDLGEKNANDGGFDAFILKMEPKSGNLEWVKQFGETYKKQFLSNTASQSDTCIAMTKDSEGNVICAGSTYGSLGETYGGSADALIIKMDPNGKILWMKQFGAETFPGGEASQWDTCNAVAVDKSGNIFCAGYTGGQLADSNSQAVMNAFVAKMDKDGNLQWIKQLGQNTPVPGPDGYSWSGCAGISVDDNGNSFCAGFTGGSLGDVNSSGAVNKSNDAFVMKLTSSGSIEWITQLGANTAVPGGDSKNWEACQGVANDKDGNVYCTGYTNGSLGEKAAGGADAFVMKLDTKGKIVWITQLGDETQVPGGLVHNADYAQSVTVNDLGNVISVGWTQGSLGEENAGSGDIFIMNLDSNGKLQWIKQFGAITKTPGGDATGFEYAASVTSDKKGNSYITGYTTGSLGEKNSRGSSGGADAFIIKLDQSGELIWMTQLGQETHVPSGDSTKEEYCFGIAVDDSGNSYCAGYTQGSLGEENAGANDIFILKLNPNGKLK